MKPLMRYAMMRSGNENRDDNRDDNRVDSRFRDRTGREHYDDGRFAPMRSAYEGGIDQRGYRDRMAYEGREPPRGGYGRPYMGMGEPVRDNYERPSMGYSEPVRMGGDAEEEYRRKWTITENNGGSPQYRGERNADGMTRIYGFGGSRVDYPRMDEMESRHGEKHSGHASGKAIPPFNREMAEAWMAGLQNEDGSRGPHWSMEEVKAVMQQHGVRSDPTRLWAAMNAEYSDMVALARKHGVDKPEFYLDSAMARWIDDKDAVSDKLAAYYTCIVQH